MLSILLVLVLLLYLEQSHALVIMAVLRRSLSTSDVLADPTPVFVVPRKAAQDDEPNLSLGDTTAPAPQPAVFEDDHAASTARASESANASSSSLAVNAEGIMDLSSDNSDIDGHRSHRHHHHHRKQKGHGPRGLIKGAPLRTMDLKTTLRHADSPMRATAAEELQAAEAEVRHHDDARQRMHRAIVRL